VEDGAARGVAALRLCTGWTVRTWVQQAVAMDTDTTYKRAVERQVRARLADVAATHAGVRTRGLDWVVREGR